MKFFFPTPNKKIHTHHTPLKKMSTQEWEPERVKNVGVVFSTYAPHIRVGDKLALDMDGDPCSLHRRSDPIEVTEIWEEEGGGRRFRAVDDQANAYELDNMSLKPSNMWELHSSSRADMEERIIASREEHRGGDQEGDDQEGVAETSYRSTLTSLNAHLQSLDRKLDEVLQMQTRMDGMEANIRRMNEETTKGFRATTDTMRHFAGDVLKLAKDSSFSGHFVEAVDNHREKEAAESAPNSPATSAPPPEEKSSSSEVALEDQEFRATTPASRSKVDFRADDSTLHKQATTPVNPKKVVFMAEGESLFAPFTVTGP